MRMLQTYDPTSHGIRYTVMNVIFLSSVDNMNGCTGPSLLYVGWTEKREKNEVGHYTIKRGA